jgi:hypothetical protein
MKKRRLSPEQAFAAMSLFLERYHVRGGDGDDLAGLLGDIQINERDGLPFDPAAWTDWLAAVEDILDRQHLPAAEE